MIYISCVICSGDATKEDSKSDGGSDTGRSPEKILMGGGGGSSSATPTPKLEGPKEFVPGQKWEWKDPKEVAEDPNATPGSLKNQLSAGLSGSFQSTISSQLSYGGGGVTPTKMNDYPRVRGSETSTSRVIENEKL